MEHGAVRLCKNRRFFKHNYKVSTFMLHILLNPVTNLLKTREEVGCTIYSFIGLSAGAVE